MARRGPNTERGKATSGRNAVKHGLTSDALVVPGESLAEWQRFLAGIIASYEPVGRLETQHATTIASLMWRLRRVPRYEAAAIAARIESVEYELQVQQVREDGPVDWDNLPDVPPERVAEAQR